MGSSSPPRREGKEKIPEMKSPECLSEEAHSAEKPGGSEREK